MTALEFSRLHNIDVNTIYNKFGKNKELFKDGHVNCKKIYELHNKKVNFMNHAHDLYYKLSNYMDDASMAKMLALGSEYDKRAWLRFLKIKLFAPYSFKDLELDIDDMVKKFVERAESIILSTSLYYA